jgi:hypothetical protein
MSFARLRRGFSSAATLLLGGLAFVGLALVVPTGPSASAADAAKATAGYQTTERLVLEVAVPPAEAGQTLLVELVGPDKKVIDKASRKVAPGRTETSQRFEFTTPKVVKGKVSVRTSVGGRSTEVALHRILLAKAHETSLTGSATLFAGSRAALRCSVRGVKSLTETVPLASDVVVRMTGPDVKKALFQGRTNAEGVADVSFQVPGVKPGSYKLEVLTKSAFGEETLQRDVRVQNSAKVLLTTDKPLYQPGQTMHLRALALRSFDLVPVGRSALTLEVEDGKGNKVFKQALETSAHGIASADFTLADEVNMGDYRIRALLGEQTAEKTVEVKRYVLPKFKTELKTDKAFYLPQETIKGTLQVDYLFGKPVAGGAVELKASTFDVAFKDFHTFKGKTDKSGHVKFEIKLPSYFVGTPLAKGNAIVRLEAKVTDSADHEETVTRTYPVSDKSIRVTLIPEGGKLIPGIENRIFAAALYPDGSPAECSVDVWMGRGGEGRPLATLKTSQTGLAELKLTPKAGHFRPGAWQQRNVEMLGGMQQRWGPTNVCDLTAEARDARGNKARAILTLSAEPLGDNVLLRLDKAVYTGGESVAVDVCTTAGLPTVFLDVVKSGQTMLTRWLDVKAGAAACKLDLPAGAFGALEVHAYQMLSTGEIIRDTRLAYVNPASELKVKVSADKDVYRPGADGVIRFEVTDTSGKPAPAALGVLIVDEAVYALQEMQPGLEKVYFTLQKELLQPAAQAVYKPSEGLDTIIRRRQVPRDTQQVARVLLTAVKPQPPGGWNINPGLARRQQARAKLQQLSAGLLTACEWSTKPVVVRDKAGKWRFADGLLEAAVKAGRLSADQVTDPVGGKLTLEGLAGLETGFTPERLAKVVTRVRLQRMMVGVVARANANRTTYFKDGKWVFTAKTLADVVADQKLSEGFLRDAWGNALSLGVRFAKTRNATGYEQFNNYELRSAGPDGKFGTADDLTAGSIDDWSVRNFWWQESAAGSNTQLAYRDRSHNRWEDPRWRMRFGGRPGGGRFPPLPGRPARGGGTGGGGKGRAKAAKGTKGKSGPPKAIEKVDEKPRQPADGGGEVPAAPAARLREYFPETLLWRPALITDERGRATLKLPFADSITTWRLTASASSRSGALGGASAPLRVFQDFFADIDLPVALTQNDEVAFPVAVYNYLRAAQTVSLELKEAPWFEVIDGLGLKRTLKLEPNQVASVKFRIRAKKVGRFSLLVDARGAKMSDAVKRGIDVLPDGASVEQVFTDRLKGTVTHTVTVPPEAIDGASRLFVKLYPGVHSQLVEGADAMLRMPTGCFEQTSSAAYPNILVVDYLKRSRTGSPATLMRAEQFLNAGYQRLLTFERPGGGFDWWGSGEPLVWLSAYGLQEFNDMAKVWPIDRGVIERTQRWLMKQQAADGTWSKIGATHGESIERMGDPKLLLTSYVAWALLDSMPRPAGWQKSEHGKQLRKAIEYIRAQAPRAENAYILALSANALASWDARDDSTFEAVKKVLRKLDEKKDRVAGWKAIRFPAAGQSLAYARGDSMTVETTALAVLAMLKNGQFTNSVNGALTYLVKSKGAGGAWGSTQATILALKALLAGLGGQQHKGVTPFAVKVNGKQVAQGKVTEANCDLMQQFDLREHLKGGANEVSLEVKGETALMYQVVGRNFLPHARLKPPVKPVLEVAVAYDREKLTTADLLKAKATLRYNGARPTYQVIVDLPIPPGFTVDGGDFAELVAAKKIMRFSVTARQVTLYVGDVKSKSEHVFEYSLKPRYPIKAKAPAAVAYEYYTPAHRAASKPVALVVAEKK